MRQSIAGKASLAVSIRLASPQIAESTQLGFDRIPGSCSLAGLDPQHSLPCFLQAAILIGVYDLQIVSLDRVYSMT